MLELQYVWNQKKKDYPHDYQSSLPFPKPYLHPLNEEVVRPAYRTFHVRAIACRTRR